MGVKVTEFTAAAKRFYFKGSGAASDRTKSLREWSGFGLVGPCEKPAMWLVTERA
jgi:hypothetical protein